MKNLLIALVILCLLLSSCTGQAPAVADQSAASPPDQPQVQSGQETQNSTPFSYVKGLVGNWIDDLGVDAAMGEEAVRAVYRSLVEQVYFADPVGLDIWRCFEDTSQPIPFLENRALSPLLFRIGSCEDFAAAMVLLLEAAGFEAEYVAGYTVSIHGDYVDHAWAVVELDGSWYHLDPQLEQNVTKNHTLTYRYYLKDDDSMLADHRWGENLISFWSHMPQEEKQLIRDFHTPPACPESYSAPEPETIPLPENPDLGLVEMQIQALITQSDIVLPLPYMELNVEPPILVAEHHVTPPLQIQYYASAPSRYGRSFLEGDQARLYDNLLQWARQPEEGAAIALSLSPVEAQYVIDTFLGDYPEYYWGGFTLGQDGLVAGFSGSLTWDEIQRRDEELARFTQGFLADAGTLSSFQQATLIHDYLADNVDYDRDNTGQDSSNIYGALIEGAAYCEGYARSFQYLANLCGLEVIYIRGHNSVRGIPHTWNAVKLEGNWRYVDVTWDRPLDPEDDVYHDYFLISLEEMTREHLWDNSQYSGIPDASPAQRDYYDILGYTVSGNPRDPAEDLAEVFFSQLSRKEDFPLNSSPVFLEVKVPGGEDEYQVWKDHFVKEIFAVLEIMEAKAREQELPFTIAMDTSVRCDFNDTMQVLTFYPKVMRLEV